MPGRGTFPIVAIAPFSRGFFREKKPFCIKSSID